MTITFTVFKGSSSGEIKKSETTIPSIKAKEVLLEHTHSGVCGTDSHHIKQDMVLGHEGVGIAKEVGSGVKDIKIGDRLGFGYVRGGCDECQYCKLGYTWHCTNTAQIFGQTDLDQGSFATHSVWPSTRLVKIPEAIASADAGPFMCAGQTVFVPMLRNNFKAGERVGVIGIGGLGHLAIQFAAALGCEVVVLSSSSNKKQEAMDFGAKEFYNTNEMVAGDVKKIDHLMVTSSALPDWRVYAELMAPFGAIHPLTIAFEDLVFPYGMMILKELTIVGSCSSSMEEVKQMVQFVVKHHIKPVVEKFPMSVEGITEAFQKLENGKIRYRGVLEVEVGSL
ncbi:chaperonin 10-like protein [Amylocarpus encephaloides]|uniref:Chaperonin 10-like protein n=1 Tax=Amylocarpus encephaloides TaxID=45428 RepID=A0A9P8C5U5_9HELO|nr:chaperonin 10-like protein [Amylocarpus encephaloides]